MTKFERCLLAAAAGLFLLLLRPPIADALRETDSGAPGASCAVLAGGVDLNRADGTALRSLPGVGEALAGRIVLWREEHGGFRCAEDLSYVDGIGEKTMEKIYECRED